MPLADGLPSYAELPIRPGLPQGCAWGVFGDDDQVGTFNFLTPERANATPATDDLQRRAQSKRE